ncbi:MAG: hypothetical protein FJ215_12710, partial [Ignavibacteria bacterium]|nr:hypothetical protein [Ignavibacteria bacterium]
MKKKHIIPCLAMLALLFANISLAQRIRLEGTDNILAALRSSKFDTLLAALRKIEDKKIVGAIPILEERIWQQDPDMQEFFLRTLWKLGSPNTLALARAYIDTANGFSSIRPMPRDPLRMKVLAIDILFSYGDYATASLVFELLERDKPYVDPFARNLLASIARSVPNFSEKAKNLLVEISAK